MAQARQLWVEQPASPTNSDWQRISPVLDDAIARLSESLRAALVLRFFEGQTFEQTARRLGISEAATRQRIRAGSISYWRALGKRGVAVPTAADSMPCFWRKPFTPRRRMTVGAATFAAKGAVASAKHAALAKASWGTTFAAKAAAVVVATGVAVAGGAAR